ncbi:RNase H domain-containing protein [Trichonephila clavipes]|nr:RNase H domain-containing protein [Trichonephila clavipes]
MVSMLMLGKTRPLPGHKISGSMKSEIFFILECLHPPRSPTREAVCRSSGKYQARRLPEQCLFGDTEERYHQPIDRSGLTPATRLQRSVGQRERRGIPSPTISSKREERGPKRTQRIPRTPFSSLRDAAHGKHADGSKRADYVCCEVVIEDITHGYKLDTSCSVFTAEAFAICRALQLIDSNMHRKYCIYADSMSVLEALEKYNDRCYPVESWSQQLDNKLLSVKPVIGAWPVIPIRTDVKLTRLLISHTRFTHRHLLFGKNAPECPSCKVSYTVRHILIDCPVFNHCNVVRR